MHELPINGGTLLAMLPGGVDEVLMDSEEEEKKSRTQLKRENQEVKELVKQLVELSPAQLRDIPLSERTLEALAAARTMVRSALQRQVRYLVRLMEEEDLATIRSALSGTLEPRAADVAALHEAEQWRDELISGDDQALSRFVEEHPTSDRQHLRQLVRNAKKERDLEKPPTSARQLFQYLKSLSTDEG